MQEHFPAMALTPSGGFAVQIGSPADLSNPGSRPSLFLRQIQEGLLAEAFLYLAEREGFEPSMGDKAHTPLAGEPLRPLGHLSGFVA